jgi:hypothetical protein
MGTKMFSARGDMVVSARPSGLVTFFCQFVVRVVE